MPVKVSCPACQANLGIPERLIGKMVKCQKCAHQFRVPISVLLPSPPSAPPEGPIVDAIVIEPAQPAAPILNAIVVDPGKATIPQATAAPEPEEEPRRRRRPPEPVGKQRHGCLTAWLISMLIGNALGMLFLLAVTAIILVQPQQRAEGYPVWVLLPTFLLLLIQVGCVTALFRWQKWGFFGVLLSQLIGLGLNLYVGLDPRGMFHAALGMVGLLVLYGVLKIGGKKSGWAQMDNQHYGAGGFLFASLLLIVAGSGLMIALDHHAAANKPDPFAFKKRPPIFDDRKFDPDKAPPKKGRLDPEEIDRIDNEKKNLKKLDDGGPRVIDGKKIDDGGPKVIDDVAAEAERRFWVGIPKAGRTIVPIPLLKEDFGIPSVHDAVMKGIAAHRVPLQRDRTYNISVESERPLRIHVHDGDGVVATQDSPGTGDRLALTVQPRKDGMHAIFITSDELNNIVFRLKVAAVASDTVRPAIPSLGSYELRVQDAVDPKTKGPSREFRFNLRVNDLIFVQVLSNKIRPVMRVYGPDGDLQEPPADKRQEQPLILAVHAKKTGEYRLIVSSENQALGGYVLELKAYKSVPTYIVFEQSNDIKLTDSPLRTPNSLANTYHVRMEKGFGYLVSIQSAQQVQVKLLDAKNQEIKEAARQSPYGGERQIAYTPSETQDYRIEAVVSGGIGTKYTVHARRFKLPEVTAAAATPKVRKIEIAGVTFIEAPCPPLAREYFAWSGDRQAFFLLAKDGFLKRVRLADLMAEKQTNVAVTPNASLYSTSVGPIIHQPGLGEVWLLDADGMTLQTRFDFGIPGGNLLTSPGHPAVLSSMAYPDKTLWRRQELIVGKLQRANGTTPRVVFLAATADGKYIGQTADGHFSRWGMDMKTLALEQKGAPLPRNTRDARFVVLSADDQFVLRKYDAKLPTETLKPGPTSGHGILGYPVADLERLAFTIDTQSRVLGMAADPKLGHIYVLTQSGGLLVTDMAGKVLRSAPITGLAGPAWDLKVHPDGGRLMLFPGEENSGNRMLLVELPANLTQKKD